MDSATQEVLLNLLKNVKETTQNTHYAHEMAWRTYSVLVKMFPDFPREYQTAKGISFREMLDWRDDQLQQLDAAIRLVESWR
jgi:hypothetical protein